MPENPLDGFVNPWGNGGNLGSNWEQNSSEVLQQHVSDSNPINQNVLQSVVFENDFQVLSTKEPEEIEIDIDELRVANWEPLGAGTKQRLLYSYEKFDDNPLRGGEDYTWGTDENFYPNQDIKGNIDQFKVELKFVYGLNVQFNDELFLYILEDALRKSCKFYSKELEQVAIDFVKRLELKDQSDYFPDSPLGNHIIEYSKGFNDLLHKLAHQFGSALIKYNGNSNNISSKDFSINFLPYLNETLALHALIGGTQRYEFFLNFTQKRSLNNRTYYLAGCSLHLFDDFGVSADDVYKPNKGILEEIKKYGLASFWILQHQRGYKPFTNVFKFNFNIKVNA